MSISSTLNNLSPASTGASSNSSSSPTSGSSSMDQNQFLQLFSAELANQDPTNPMSDSDLASQLAQFSSVEQLTQVNTNLQAVETTEASQSQVQDASMIGDQVLYSSNQVSLTAGQSTSIDASFASAPANVTVSITNSAGQVVRTLQLGPQAAGQQSFNWDGLDNDGNTLPSGTYDVSVTATDSSGKPITVTQEEGGAVTGIDFTNGYPQLVVNGQDIDLSRVSQINQPTSSAS